MRLMGLFNIRPLGFEKGQLNAEVIAQSMSDGDTVPILQWVPLEEKVPVSLVLPNATVVSGFAERALKDEATGSEVQFVRVGFCRVDGMDSDRIRLYFTHD